METPASEDGCKFMHAQSREEVGALIFPVKGDTSANLSFCVSVLSC